MSSNLTPQQPFTLKHTNVSNPSVVYSKPSQQSIAASEDYYSLASSSASSTHGENVHHNNQSQQTVGRSQTPPSRYRTPPQSSTHLPRPSRDSLQHPRPYPAQNPIQSQAQSQLLNHSHSAEVARQGQHVDFEQEGEQGRKTPMRGEGRQRSSQSEHQSAALLGAGAASSMQTSNPTTRGPQWQASGTQGTNGRTRARSSVARDLDRNGTSATPGVDDTPYIHFALDQLTRDEEVRGSRSYAGLPLDLPYQSPSNPSSQNTPWRQAQTDQWPRDQRPRDEDEISRLLPQPHPPRPAVAPALPPPPGDFREGPNHFIPLAGARDARHPPLNFLPGILRPLSLAVYLALLFAYIICLIFTASWSVANTGLWDYGTFGDGRYFVFRFLPTMLGLVLLLWLFQIEIAVYRIAPFIAMASSSPRRRAVGAQLPLQPHGFVLPYLGHFRAGQPVFGAFLIIAWLQVFQIPLLASSFNVYFLGSPSTGHWRWIATQGVIWVVIVLYIFLFLALIILQLWLRRTETGLKWDPRSLADIIVLLERSNALDPQDPVGQLGYWRTTNRPNETLHTFGIADKPARTYAMENGQIREKATEASARRYSDPDMDIEAGQPRASKDAILPPSDAEYPSSTGHHHTGPLPWFLWPSFALLWPIIAIVLLLAFLIVSYLPSTHLLTPGFLPSLPAFVDTMGFSSTNFFYSFLPALLATLLLLFWFSLDLAYRRLQPLASLASPSGSSAEQTLLATYASDPPYLAPLSALANSHFRLAATTLTSLLALPIPILAAGVFWSQFDIPSQRTLITVDATAFYALTVFLVLHALAYPFLAFPPRALRSLPPHVRATSFADLRDLFAHSRLLTDLAFRAPASRTDLVTRLLAPFPGVYLPRQGEGEKGRERGASASKLSLADGVRGFGRARPAPIGGEAGFWDKLPAYAFGRHVGRDGREFVGVDRVRA